MQSVHKKMEPCNAADMSATYSALPLVLPANSSHSVPEEARAKLSSEQLLKYPPSKHSVQVAYETEM
jgi:hypothetical protein